MTPELNRIYVGDCLTVMRSWPDKFINTVVTSPPYWGLRDYGIETQIGLEETPEAFIETMVRVFRDVRRLLRDDGTLWMNLGDSYNNNRTGGHGATGGADKSTLESPAHRGASPIKKRIDALLKPKDLIGMPWRVALALQADGWYLRSDIIWSKPNPMPESVLDRPTKSHEYIFLFSKSERYFYDADAIKEKGVGAEWRDGFRGEQGAYVGQSGPQDNMRATHKQKVPSGWDQGNGDHHLKLGRYKNIPEGQANIREKRDKQRGHSRCHAGFNDRWDAMKKSEQCSGMRNKRSVWTVATSPFSDAHFATFPADLIKPCILAGSMGGGIVFDPFMGAGTTALVANAFNRNFLGIEINPEYAAMAERRISSEKAQLKFA